MGNGESTAKRISMQRTEEGSVQISEEVMLRLRKGKGKEIYEEPPENEIKIKEENLKLLLNDAYKKGRLDGEKKAVKEMETKRMENENANADNNLKLKDIEESMQQRNVEINELNMKLNELELIAESKLKEKQESLDSITKQLNDEKREKDALYEKISETTSKLEEQSLLSEQSFLKLEEEQKQKEEYLKMLEARNETTRVEFDRGINDVVKMMQPLQKGVLCKDLQQEVLECYIVNKNYPLRCSEVVAKFRDCVQNTRRRKMERDETS